MCLFHQNLRGFGIFLRVCPKESRFPFISTHSEVTQFYLRARDFCQCHFPFLNVTICFGNHDNCKVTLVNLHFNKAIIWVNAYV